MMRSNVARRSSHSASGNENGISRRLIPMIKAVAIGLLATTVLLLLSSFAMTKNNIPFSLVNPMSVGSLIVGTMLAGFLAARSIREKGMMVGAGCGLIVFVILLMASFLTQFDIGAQAVIKLAISAISGAIGGILGVNARTRRK